MNNMNKVLQKTQVMAHTNQSHGTITRVSFLLALFCWYQWDNNEYPISWLVKKNNSTSILHQNKSCYFFV